MARDAGIKSVQATPSMAIGSYDATPLDMAGAYTVFANDGLHIDPWMLASVRTATGDVINDYSPDSKQVLDPRVAYLTVSLMENVLHSDVTGTGTGAGVRNMGFHAPAAGKTGTDHDAWFAGFTTNLLCIVWVGNDDYTDIKIEGAHAAAPIWAEFMKRAVQLPQYSDTNEFTVPEGVEIVPIDSASNLRSDDSLPGSHDQRRLPGRHRAHRNLRPPRRASQPAAKNLWAGQELASAGCGNDIGTLTNFRKMFYSSSAMNFKLRSLSLLLPALASVLLFVPTSPAADSRSQAHRRRRPCLHRQRGEGTGRDERRDQPRRLGRGDLHHRRYRRAECRGQRPA